MEVKLGEIYELDGQLYVIFNQKDIDPTTTKMGGLAAHLRGWFVDNKLMSNEDKLVALLING